MVTVLRIKCDQALWSSWHTAQDLTGFHQRGSLNYVSLTLTSLLKRSAPIGLWDKFSSVRAKALPCPSEGHLCLSSRSLSLSTLSGPTSIHSSIWEWPIPSSDPSCGPVRVGVGVSSGLKNSPGMVLGPEQGFMWRFSYSCSMTWGSFVSSGWC